MYWERRGGDVIGGWRRLHNDEIRDNFNPTPNIITLIKSSRMNGPGMWHARGSRDVYRVLMGKCGDLGVDMKIILNWVLKNGKTENGFIWHRTGASGGGWGQLV